MSNRPGLDIGAIIRQVRRRWRLRLALRGATTVLAVGVALLVVAALSLRVVRFDPAMLLGLRVALGVVFATVVGAFVVRPLLRRVTDQQVALYIEEHEPSLEAAVLSAVEHSDTGVPEFSSKVGDGADSPVLVARVIESAIEKCFATQAATQAEQQKLVRYSAAVAVVLFLGLGIFGAGPGYLRQALSALFLFASDLQAAAPLRIDVTPGNATVPKGADQTVTARLWGFDSDEATLLMRRSDQAEFEEVPLLPGEQGQFEGMLFDVAGPVDYLVEADGVRSPAFALTVVELPYVEQLKLEYTFPSYTGLEPQTVENGGDVAVLAGTEVRVIATPTMAVPGGRLTLNEEQNVPLHLQADGTLVASFRADDDGFYRIELDATTGEHVAATPQYTIDVLTDLPPQVSFSKPGRDTSASPIEEVFVEAMASDDYGVRDLELVYSVNGGPEKTLTLFEGTERLPRVSAGHTFYLEELGVEAGDAVSYYARAADQGPKGSARQRTSDLYFVRVRPFSKDFRAAQSMAGGGGTQGGGADALSEQQRRIIAATFNIQRDRETFAADRLRENAVVVGLSQSRLREQVEGLVKRMSSRFLEPDPAFKKIAELLPKAIAEMTVAEAKLAAVSPDGALPAEHRALGFLQRAEEEYETQVSTGQQGGGGGGGGSAMSKELAEIFEMDLDKLANQYETADRASQQSGDQELDELLEKLKDLARRQEQQAEQQRRRALAGQANGGGSSGDQQRQLAEQAEEAARQLERLSRDQKRPDLMDVAQRLREVAEAMRKAAAGGAAGSEVESKAALERLRQAEKQLRGAQSDRAKRDIEDAQRRAAELAQAEREITAGVRSMGEKTGSDRRQALGELGDRKETLAADVIELERDLDRSAGDAARNEKEAARRMAEAAGAIRDSRLRDKVRYSQQMLGRVSRETMEAVERDIADGIDTLRKKLDQAAAALGQSAPENRKDEVLDRAERLARGMETMAQRTREQMERNARQRAQQGQQGQQDQSGEEADLQGSQDDGRANNMGSLNGSVFGGWDGRHLDPEAIRQLRGEVRQLTQEAQELRRRLTGDVVDSKELDEILERLRQLDDERVYQDASELERLQTFVAEGLKRFEYTLRRQSDEKNKEVALSGADQVPDTFRPLVEQYYRSLSKASR
jgi:hypothetical protein